MKQTKKSDKTPVAPKAHATVEARPAPIVRNDWEYSRLRLGDLVVLDGRKHVITMVNSCRARAVPLAKKRVDYETVDGKRVKFDTCYATVNISPNSEIPILKRFGPDWKAKVSVETEDNNKQKEKVE
jgi:hypothetical protein